MAYQTAPFHPQEEQESIDQLDDLFVTSPATLQFQHEQEFFDYLTSSFGLPECVDISEVPYIYSTEPRNILPEATDPPFAAPQQDLEIAQPPHDIPIELIDKRLFDPWVHPTQHEDTDPQDNLTKQSVECSRYFQPPLTQA